MPPIIAAFAATGALWGGFIGVGAIVATTAGAIIVGGIAGALVGLVFEELLMPDLPDSPTYKSGQPVYTIEEGKLIAKPYGRCKIAGNIIRSNDPGDDNFKIIIGHGHGEIDSLLSWKINSIEWDSLIGVKWWEASYAGSVHWKNTALGTDSQTLIQVNGTDLFSLEACGYRGIAHTGFKLTKNNQIGSFGSVSVEGRFLLCEPIGGGAKVFSRNPAVIMWDFYRNVEGYEIADLDTNAFTSLETLCDFCPPIGEGGPIRPPGPNNTTVKATSHYLYSGASYQEWSPFYAFDANKAVEGVQAYNEWSSAEGQANQQRLNVDLGFPIVLKKIVIVNSHGVGLTQGIKSFAIQGSNTAADLDHTDYLDGASGWTAVSAHNATQYDSNDPYKDYEVTIPKPAYRYYSIKILGNHGDADFMRVRDICFWGRSPRYTFDYNFDSKININDAKKLIWSSFDGRVIRSQGKLKPVWDWSTMADGSGGLTAKTSQYSFTMDNIVKDSFIRLPAKRSNKVTVEYLDSSEGYKKIPITEKDDSDIDERGEVTLDVKAYYITQRDVAARKCKRLFYRALYSGDQCKLTGFPSSQKLEVYDLVQVTHTIPSWTAEEFIILSKAEDEYGRPTFLLRPYYTGLFDDVETPISSGHASIFPRAWDIPPSSTGITVALVGGPGSEYDYRSVKVSFTPPAEYLFYSRTEIYASRDDSVYYLTGTSRGEDFVIQGMGMLYYPGDTCYIKLKNISRSGVPESMPIDADASIVIPGTIRSARFYLGLNNIWGGNAAIDNIATTIVLGNLDGISKIALGPSADLLTLANTSTYPGFFADGQGYFRAGGAAGYVKWNGSVFTIAGTLIASSIHIPDQDTTANSFHVQSDGDTWWGCTETNFNADNDNALAYVLKTGIAKFQNIDVTGGTVSGFYAGLYDLWGGNAVISNIATTIVLGNLDGISKIALGAYADALSISNMSTYPGFFADGQGYFRGGGTNKYIQWNGEITIKAGADFLIDSANQKMTLGSGNNLIALDAADATYRLAIGHATYGSAPFRVTKAGAITAISGTIGGWTLGATTLTGTGITLSSTGDAYIAFGATPPTGVSAGTGIFINKTGLFGLNANTQNFKIDATNGSITAISGTIGGWTLASDKLSAGTDADYIGLIPGIGIQMGDSTFADAEFSVTNAGVLKAVSGTIGGFTINATEGLYAGSGITRVQMKPGAGIWCGATAIGDAPFSVTMYGIVKATSGTIGGWTLATTTLSSANICLDQANDKITVNTITIDGANNRIRSDNYVSGVFGSGFNLEPDLFEVGNIACRGIIRTAVFQKDVVSCIGGNLAVAQADLLNADMVANDEVALTRISEAGDTRISEASDTRISEGIGSLTIEGNETFAIGDILRIKDGTDDEWLEVATIANAPTYGVQRDKGGDYAANSNPAWKKGASVINYKQSGDGAVYMTASESNAPYISVFTHAGSPWDTITTHIRMGNLNGYAGYGLDTYGWAAYIDANNYIKIDPTNGIRMSGNIIITGGSMPGLTLDDLADGAAYGRVAMTAISAGRILLTSAGVSGSLPVSLSDAKCTDANADQTSAHQAATVASLSGLDLDDLASGTSYGRVQQAVLDSGYLYLMRRSTDATEQMLITAGGIEGYVNSVKNFELANGIAYLGDQANEHIKLSSSGLQIYDGVTLYATYGSTTTLGLTASEHIRISGSAVQIKNGATVYTDLTNAILTLGDTSNENVLINTSGIQLRDGATIYGVFAATTTLGLTASEHIKLTSTSVQFKDGASVYTNLAAGILQLGLVSGGEYIQIDSTGIEGYGGATKRFEITSAGLAYLGDQSNEHIKLSSSGLQIYDGAILYATYGATTTLGLTVSEHINLTSTSVQFKDGANVYTDLTAGVLKLGLVSGGEYVQIDSTGIEGYGGTTKRFEITSAGLAYLGDQSNEHIKLSSSGLQIYDGATLYATYGATTTIGLTASEHISISGSAIQFKDGGTVYTSISGGNILVGQTGAGQSNVYITSGAIQLRNNTTAFLTLSNAGIANLIIKSGGDALFEHGGDIKFTSVTVPTACTGALAGAGAGNVDNGDHYYKITFINATGETELSAASNLITVVDKTANGKVSLTGIPTSSSSSVTKRKIYRTKAGASNYYYLAEIANNTGTTYTDNIADASLGAFIYNDKINDTFGKIYVDGVSSIMLATTNTFAGQHAGANITSGQLDVGVGSYALGSITTGTRSTAVGHHSCASMTTGERCTAVGYGSLYSNIIGCRDIALGRHAGRYELGDDAFYVNNRDRVNTAGDKSKSLLYGIMAVLPANQKLTINALLNLSVSKTPASAGAAGTAGDVAWDTGFIYICTAANTWKRRSIATW